MRWQCRLHVVIILRVGVVGVLALLELVFTLGLGQCLECTIACVLHCQLRAASAST